MEKTFPHIHRIVRIYIRYNIKIINDRIFTANTLIFNEIFYPTVVQMMIMSRSDNDLIVAHLMKMRRPDDEILYGVIHRVYDRSHFEKDWVVFFKSYFK